MEDEARENRRSGMGKGDKTKGIGEWGREGVGRLLRDQNFVVKIG